MPATMSKCWCAVDSFMTKMTSPGTVAPSWRRPGSSVNARPKTPVRLTPRWPMPLPTMRSPSVMPRVTLTATFLVSRLKPVPSTQCSHLERGKWEVCERTGSGGQRRRHEGSPCGLFSIPQRDEDLGAVAPTAGLLLLSLTECVAFVAFLRHLSNRKDCGVVREGQGPERESSARAPTGSRGSLALPDPVQTSQTTSRVISRSLLRPKKRSSRVTGCEMRVSRAFGGGGGGGGVRGRGGAFGARFWV